ncbi:MAG: hypothetical protein P4L90_10205 [Rhodopila sp.]|nr:hypothetical protein [Rhodopila sp.]
MPGQDADEETQRLAHREAARLATVERETEAARAGRIAERVKTFVAAGAPAGLECGDVAGLTPGRLALVRHLVWIQDTDRRASAARLRAAEIAQAVDRWNDAKSRLAALDTAVSEAFDGWMRFGSTGESPDMRSVEREQLRLEVAEHEVLAGLSESSLFEVAVADATITALEGMTPGLQFDVLAEMAAADVARIKTLARELEGSYGRLAALGRLVRQMDLPLAAQQAIVERLAMPQPIERHRLPDLPHEAVSFPIAVSENGLAGWRDTLAQVELDPRGDGEPGNGTPSTKPSRLARACRKLVGVQ